MRSGYQLVDQGVVAREADITSYLSWVTHMHEVQPSIKWWLVFGKMRSGFFILGRSLALPQTGLGVTLDRTTPKSRS